MLPRLDGFPTASTRLKLQRLSRLACIVLDTTKQGGSLLSRQFLVHPCLPIDWINHRYPDKAGKIHQDRRHTYLPTGNRLPQNPLAYQLEVERTEKIKVMAAPKLCHFVLKHQPFLSPLICVC